MDAHSLQLLEFDRVTALIAGRAACSRAADRLRDARPLVDADARAAENRRLAEAIARSGAPGAWCAVGPTALGERLATQDHEPLDGPALRELLAWPLAARATREAWDSDDLRARHPALAARVDALPDLDPLADELERCLDADGRVRDSASPALARARVALARGERELERMLDKWARGFGENAFVTRYGDRFVAMVPAAGFPRRRGVVHGVSGSGQSLLVEPLEACESNNRLLEARALAADEERRVLRALDQGVREARGPLEVLEEILAHLDALRAAAQWAREVGGIALDPGGERLTLRGARHPLLASSERAAEVVPLDLELGPQGRLLLVSGPNMGGKTVLLKTVGLSVALAHAALPVPAAEGSRLPVIDGIWADLGDEQSVDRGLSTFAAHLASLRAIAVAAGPATLLLCDELGAGTDPDEGAALGRALVEHVASRGAWGVITTHLGSLKRLAGEVPGVVNGSLDFDEATFTSRFRFLPGVPGASHALSVAERLGFPPDVLRRARELTPQSALEMERLLADLRQARVRAEAEAAALRETREAEAAAERVRAASATDTRARLEAARGRLTAESDALLARVRELWQTIQREARRSSRTADSVEALRAALQSSEAASEAITHQADATLAEAGMTPATRPLDRPEIGRRVRIADLGVEAEIVSLPDAEGRLMLRRGSWSIQSHVSRLRPADAEAPALEVRRAAGGGGANWQTSDDAPALEVDLRGKDVDEALREVDQGLDRAVLAGLHELRIIHGVGRGVLRAAVERHLRAHPQVASQRLGLVGEGGRGVTVAVLR